MVQEDIAAGDYLLCILLFLICYIELKDIEYRIGVALVVDSTIIEARCGNPMRI